MAQSIWIVNANKDPTIKRIMLTTHQDGLTLLLFADSDRMELPFLQLSEKGIIAFADEVLKWPGNQTKILIGAFREMVDKKPMQGLVNSPRDYAGKFEFSDKLDTTEKVLCKQFFTWFVKKKMLISFE